MMENEETQGEQKIVLLERYKSSIEANLAKTKLDANDIPCFLTGENMADLYQGVGAHFQAFSVSLFVFETDIEAASQILKDSPAEGEDGAPTQCPHCSSLKVVRDFPQSMYKKFLPGLTAIFFGLWFPQRRVYHCLDCDQEFN
jgi:hypothetical protein